MQSLKSSSSRADARPNCAQCKSVMDLANVIPGLGLWSHRFFECADCGQLLVMPENPAEAEV